MSEDERRVVCIVDDDESLRRSLRNLLMSAGFRVETFPSAEAFLESVHRQNTGCMVLDLRMAGMSGLELLRHLAAAQLLLLAVLITGWVSGLRPALIAWGLATLALKYYFTPPLDSLTVDVAHVPRLIIFALVAMLMATLSAARRQAEDALKSAR